LLDEAEAGESVHDERVDVAHVDDAMAATAEGVDAAVAVLYRSRPSGFEPRR
jgi:hypothetical protein